MEWHLYCSSHTVKLLQLSDLPSVGCFRFLENILESSLVHTRRRRTGACWIGFVLRTSGFGQTCRTIPVYLPRQSGQVIGVCLPPAQTVARYGISSDRSSVPKFGGETALIVKALEV